MTPQEKQDIRRDTSVFVSLMITIATLSFIAFIAYHIVKKNYLKKEHPVTKIETSVSIKKYSTTQK